MTKEKDRNLERERAEFLAHLSSLISEPLRRQIEGVAQTHPAPPQFTLIVSHIGAANANQK